MNELFWISDELCARIVRVLAHFTWQGTVIAFVAILCATAFRRASAEARYRIYVAALLSMAASPFVTFVSLRPSQLTMGTIAAPAAMADASIMAPSPLQPTIIEVGVPSFTPRPEIDAARPVPIHYDPVPPRRNWSDYAPHAVAAYLVGVGIMFVRLLMSIHGGRKMRKTALPLEDALASAIVRRVADRLSMDVVPLVCTSAAVTVPCVLGILRPLILLPPAMLSGLRPDQIEAILTHEFAHLKHHDHLVNLLQRLIEAVLFFHPCVWLISRKIRIEREHRCDDTVLRHGASAAAYADTLLRVAAMSATAGDNIELAATGRQTSLRGRIVRMLRGREDVQIRLSRVWVAVVVMLAGIGSSAMWYHRNSAQAAQQQEEPTSVIGVLRDTLGRPVSNARIAPDGENAWYGVRSDVNGQFELKDIKPGQRQFIAWSQRSRRMALIRLPEDATALKSPIEPTFRYFEADADGIVTDASGNPVKGAWVRIFLSAPDGSIWRVLTYSPTDSSGYYQVGHVPAGKGLKLWATLSDDPQDRNRTEAIELDDQYQFELPPLAVRTTTAPSPQSGPQRVRYSGRVVDEQGKPVPGVELQMWYPKNQMIYDAGRVMTNADGEFSRLLPPDADRVSFRLMHPDFLSYHFTNRMDITPSIEALRAGTAVITVKRGLPLRGVVRDASTNEAIFNALVLAGRSFSTTPGPESEPIEDWTSPRTDRAGEFVARGLPEGVHMIQVSTDGYAPKIITVNLTADSKSVEVTLERGLTYSGTVVDGEGNPVEGANVGVMRWNAPGGDFPLVRFTKTDAQGQFTLSNLPSEGSLNMYTSKRGSNQPSVSFSWSPQGPNRDVITLLPPANIIGTVVDALTGEPVPKYRLTPVWYASGERPSILTMAGRKDVNSPDGSFEFSFGNFGVGVDSQLRVAARIVAEGYVPQITPGVLLSAKPEPMLIRLVRGESLAGIVRDSTGQALAGAIAMRVEDLDDLIVEGTRYNDDPAYLPKDIVRTDAEGKFKLPPAEEPGRFVAVHEQGYAILDATLIASNQSITLTPWAAVEGTLRINGQPANGVEMALSPPDRGVGEIPKPIQFNLRAMTDVNGRFRFNYVPEMPFVLAINGPQGLSNGRVVVPQAGKTVTIDLGNGGRTAVGALDLSAVPEPVQSKWIRARAFRISPAPQAPPGLKDVAAWQASVAALAEREPSIDDPLSLIQNYATVSADGSRLWFQGLEPGHYVVYINAHAPPEPNMCGFGRLLATAKAEFHVPADSGNDEIQLPPLPLTVLAHPDKGDLAPDFRARTFDGKDISLSQFRGKYVVLDFWASWCGPCQMDTPALKPIYDELAKNGDSLVVLGMNFDWDKPRGEAFIKEHNLNWPQAMLGTLSFENAIAKAYGVSAVPSVWLIGPDGKVLAKDLRSSTAEAMVRSLLKK